MAVTKTTSRIEELFAEARPKTQKLHKKALKLLPGGVEHDMRIHSPFPVFMERGEGAYKWDVDGNRYVDYIVGHGALLLGHNHPAVMEPVRQQLSRGTHLGASHEHMVEWAEWVCKLVPSAEMVRFHSSGTEATLMALRMCRAVTGRDKLLKFRGHFHGWHDYMTIGYQTPFDVPSSAGIPDAIADLVVSIPPNDAALVRKTIEADGDIACVFLEPNRADVSFARELREICTDLDVPLVFDEVITGFRYAPGGFQGEFGITPDLTTLAKILAGGFPGGAVAGQRRFLETIEPGRPRGQRISHPGTYNANPISAVAGAACLKYIADGKPHAKANRLAELLRKGLARVIKEQGIDAKVTETYSWWAVAFGDGAARGRSELGSAFATAMMVNGVHVSRPSGMLSAAHSEEDIDFTLDAFDKSLKLLKTDGYLS